jgi:aspartokinase-like uncharacterized kinase
MSGNVRSGGALVVIKIGGGLTRVPGGLDGVCSNVVKLSREHALVVVPGGGPFSDAVRAFESHTGLSADAAHWMAILGMDQYAHALVDRIAGAVLVEEPGEVGGVVSAGQVAVLAPARWMRSADVLPHSWSVTSDSIAAFVAGALGAERLVLIKPTESVDPVDPYFQTALPLGLPYRILSWQQFEELRAWLSEPIAAGARRE